jgi:hypothetical protein
MSLAAEILLKGQKVVLKHNMTDPHEAERIITLAANKIREAESRAPQAASHQIALLALIELASEYLMAKDRTAAYQQKIQDKSQAIADLFAGPSANA